MNAIKGAIYSSCVRAQVPVRKRFICARARARVCVCVCVCVCGVCGVCGGGGVCARVHRAHSYACTLVDVYTLCLLLLSCG